MAKKWSRLVQSTKARIIGEIISRVLQKISEQIRRIKQSLLWRTAKKRYPSYSILCIPLFWHFSFHCIASLANSTFRYHHPEWRYSYLFLLGSHFDWSSWRGCQLPRDRPVLPDGTIFTRLCCEGQSGVRVEDSFHSKLSSDETEQDLSEFLPL